MYKSKKCIICNEKFLPISGNQTSCSKDCHQEDKRRITRKYHKIHKESEKIYRKHYCKMHKVQIAEQTKKWHQKNKQKLIKYKKNYCQSHRKEIAEYNRSKRKTDVNFKISGYLRGRLYQSLKGFYKSNSAIKLLDCSIEKLKKQLKKQFTEGMSWSNYGKWHIDHIRPCASFDLSKPSEQRKCFHYTNLQPLWAAENQSKSDKLI
jgi:hypothetical protein